MHTAQTVHIYRSRSQPNDNNNNKNERMNERKRRSATWDRTSYTYEVHLGMIAERKTVAGNGMAAADAKININEAASSQHSINCKNFNDFISMNWISVREWHRDARSEEYTKSKWTVW